MIIVQFKDVTRTYMTGDHVQNALAETQQPAPQVPPTPTGATPMSPQPNFRQVVPNQQNIKQAGNATAPMPRPAVTPFNDA